MFGKRRKTLGITKPKRTREEIDRDYSREAGFLVHKTLQSESLQNEIEQHKAILYSLISEMRALPAPEAKTEPKADAPAGATA